MKKTVGILSMVAALTLAGAVAQAGTLKVVFSGGLDQGSQSLIKAFNQQYKNIRVEPIILGRDGMDFSMAVGKKPDVYVGFFTEMGNYADIGIFLDVAKLLPAKALRDIPPGFSDAFAVGKHLLGIPVGGFTTGLYYNPGLFAKAGLKAPDATWTWENQFYAACRKLTRNTSGSGNAEVYGVAGLTCNQFGNQGMPSPSFLSTLYSYGGSIVDRKFTKVEFMDKPAMQAINFVLKLHKEKLTDMSDYSFDNQSAADWPFWNGKAAMMLMQGNGDKSTFFLPTWPKGKEPNFKSAVSVIPRGPKGTIPANMTEVASVMTTTKNKNEAAKFLEFLTGVKGQEALFTSSSLLPTTRAGFASSKISGKVASPIYKAYQQGRTWSARKGYLQVEFTLWGNLLTMARGESTMADLKDAVASSCAEAISSSTYSF